MGKESTSRQRYQNQRIRRDLQGRDYYQEGKEEVIQEEDHILGDIIDQNRKEIEVFQET